jgi:hypothetical protein
MTFVPDVLFGFHPSLAKSGALSRSKSRAQALGKTPLGFYLQISVLLIQYAIRSRIMSMLANELADDLLARGRRIVLLEAEQKRVNNELTREKAEYADLVARAVKGEFQEAGVHHHNGTRNVGSNGPTEGPLRNNILALLRSVERPLTLDEIQGKVGEQRAKIGWTLMNLKRAGLVENSGRGFWRRGKADVAEEENDPDDSPELSSF